MAESTTFTGNITTQRDTYQRLTSRDIFSSKIQFAAFTKTPWTRVIGAEAFGVDSMQNLNTFTASKPTGRMIRFFSGKYAFGGAIFSTSGNSFHVGRMGSYTPELVEGGNEWKYSWHQLINTQYIPVNDVQDNTGGDIDIKMQKMEAMQSQFVQDFNYAILGNTNAPNNDVLGPSAVSSDLAALIDVTRTATVGGISKANSFWKNGIVQITSVGGGGEMDRPLILRRKLLKQFNTQMTNAESTGPRDYVLLTTQGAHEYYDRLQYADAIQGGKGDFGVSSRYDAAGVQAHAFNGAPMIWDPSVEVPTGATASTEAIYGIHIPSFGIAIRSEENFKLSGFNSATGDPWETPREHDQFKTLVASISLRYSPFVSAMRPHFVAYDLPANPD